MRFKEFCKIITESSHEHIVIWDRKTGYGQTPNQADINYFGFTVNMSYSKFRSLVPTGNSNFKTINFIKDAIKESKPISPPFLLAKWEDGIWQVHDHEGRSRADALNQLGIKEFPVDVFPLGGMRRRHITDEMMNANFKPQIYR